MHTGNTIPTLSVAALGLLLLSAPLRAAAADVRLKCPAQTRMEVQALRKGVEAHCVLGDGTRHGPWGGWFPSGQRAIAGAYDNGRLHGVETEWYDLAGAEISPRTRSRARPQRRRRSEWSRGMLHGEETEWDEGGRVLQRSTWHEGTFVSYRHPRRSAADDARLGRPFAAAGPKPRGCFARERFPRVLTNMMGEPEPGYSGLELKYGTNQNCRREALPCRTYSHAQLSDIMGQEIAGFADSARFIVLSCRTPEDVRRLTVDEELKWRERAAAHSDPGVVALLADMDGVWCGRSTHVEYGAEWFRELRLAFIDGDPQGAARATDTWSRTPGGPVGEPGYVVESVVIPLARREIDRGPDGANPATSVNFKAVNVQNNIGGYTLTRDSQGFVISRGRHNYRMSRDCGGFWAPGVP